MGTSACKAVVTNLKGNVISQSNLEVRLYHPHHLWSEQNPHEIYTAASLAIKAAMKKAKLRGRDISAMAFDSPRDSLIAIDKNGRPLTQCITWIDQRCLEQVEALKKKTSVEEVLKTTGHTIEFAFWGPKILWLKENRPHLFEQIRYFLNPANYITLQLLGVTSSHVSTASRTMLVDIKKLQWSDEMCQLIGISNEMLPPIEKEIAVLSETTSKAKDMGLGKGIPVSVVFSDDHSAAIGSGVTHTGQLGISAATNDAWYVPIDRSCVDFSGRVGCVPHVVQNCWLHTLAISSTGGSLRWFRNSFHETQKENSCERSDASYQELDALAGKAAPGTNGLLFYPYLWGATASKFNPKATGIFYGIRVEHTKSHFVRAILEGVALQYVGALRILKDMGDEIENITIFGGGARSDLWNQIKADVTNMTLATPKVLDASPFGSAILAGLATENIRDWENVNQMIHKRQVYTPSKRMHEKYKKMYTRYEKIYEILRKSYEIE